jgi:hypothetical protein
MGQGQGQDMGMGMGQTAGPGGAGGSAQGTATEQNRQNSGANNDQGSVQFTDKPSGGAGPERPAVAAQGRDTKVEQRNFEKEPWFTRLPPEVREAIRSSSERRPPRGYEDRLKNYFKSLD